MALVAGRSRRSSVQTTRPEVGRYRGRVAAGAIEAVWRIESPRIIAGLTRLVQDVGLAEELAQDAFVVALERWPTEGVPDNPGAWLMATAKHRAVDLVRRRTTYQRKLAELGRDLEQPPGPSEMDAALAGIDDYVGDDLLRLMFIANHPVLSTESRVALTLRLLGGLTTDEIARAMLVPEPTVAQRIVRAKRTLAARNIAVRVAPAGRGRCAARRRCSRWCTSSSTRGTRPRRASSGPGPRCARRPCGSVASWPGWWQRSPRCTGCSP